MNAPRDKLPSVYLELRNYSHRDVHLACASDTLIPISCYVAHIQRHPSPAASRSSLYLNLIRLYAQRAAARSRLICIVYVRARASARSAWRAWLDRFTQWLIVVVSLIAMDVVLYNDKYFPSPILISKWLSHRHVTLLLHISTIWLPLWRKRAVTHFVCDTIAGDIYTPSA